MSRTDDILESAREPIWKGCSNCDDLQAKLKAAEAKADITLETQNRIRNLVIKLSGAKEGLVDGSGCDSGDPVDLTLNEIAQGFNYLLDEIIEPLKQKLAEANDEIRRFNKMRW